MIPTAIREPIMPSMVSSTSHSPLAWYWEPEPESSSIGRTPAKAIEQDRLLTIFQEPSGTQRLHHYLEAAIQAGDLEAETASTAMRCWRTLSVALSNKLPVPDAGVGPDGQLLYMWNKAKHHFELEIFPDGHGEFFYINLQTDEMWDCEYTVGDSVPDEAKEKLREFFLYD